MTVRPIIGLFLFLCAATVHAEEITPWNFRGAMPKEAQTVQLTTAEITPEGIRISTETDGYIVWNGQPLDGPVDVVTISAAAIRPTEGSVLWRLKGGTPDQLLQAYFTIPGDGFMHEIDVLVSGYPQWDWQTEQFALAFPAGSEVIIQEIQFRHWTFYERIAEAWRSFWTFDSFRVYSINFLWGPLIATNSVLRMQLFDSLPPLGWSIGRFLYPLFIILAVVSVIIARMKRNASAGIGLFLLVFTACWLAFDVRMGAEIASYAVHDLRTYTLAEDRAKELRNYGDIYAKIEALLPETKKHEAVRLLSPGPQAYFPLLRYRAYPSIVSTDVQDPDAWFVIDRTDVGVTDEGMLLSVDANGSGTVLAGLGVVTARYDDTTFLFTVNP